MKATAKRSARRMPGQEVPVTHTSLVSRGQDAGRRRVLRMRNPWIMMMGVMSLAACGPVPKPPVTKTEAEPVAGESVRKRVGETFTVALESNPTTGYGWALDGTEDGTVVRKVGDEYVGKSHPPGMVGVGGMEQWKFRAEKKGTTMLRFIYRRPWETKTGPIRERTIHVLVE